MPQPFFSFLLFNFIAAYSRSQHKHPKFLKEYSTKVIASVIFQGHCANHNFFHAYFLSHNLFLATALHLSLLKNVEIGTLINANALQVEVDESGFSETFDMTFNLDLNLQRMQEEEGDGIFIMDFKEVIVLHREQLTTGIN